MKMNSLRKCRCGKLRYESKSETEIALKEVRSKRIGRGETRKEAIIYNCKYGYYHLSSQIAQKVKSVNPSVSADIYFAHFFTPPKAKTYKDYFYEL